MKFFANPSNISPFYESINVGGAVNDFMFDPSGGSGDGHTTDTVPYPFGR